MRCFRRLGPIKAISFDLDDTLYSNRPIMLRTGEIMLAYFAKTLGDAQPFDMRYWQPFKRQAIAQKPSLKHDVTELRIKSYTLGIQALGYDAVQALQMAKEAYDVFITARSNFDVPQESLALLDDLAKKYPLIAISNGNVDTKAIGLAHKFTHIYHAGGPYRQKPAPDMFATACKALGIKANELLHVGDCGRADIYGALSYGCQTAYLSQYEVGKPITHLPNIWLTDITQLRLLLA